MDARPAVETEPAAAMLRRIATPARTLQLAQRREGTYLAATLTYLLCWLRGHPIVEARPGRCVLRVLEQCLLRAVSSGAA